eukprot:334130-Pyramimonas_sp.AAC.1
MNATQPRPPELSWGLPPHFLHERDPEATRLVSTHYAKWMSTFEATVLNHHAVPVAKQAAYSGRANG